MTVSIAQVAKLAGVSIATVSRCLNNPEKVRSATRAKVQKAIAETNYSPNSLAQSFRRGRTNVVMVVLPTVGDPFLGDVLSGIRSRLTGHYSVLLAETDLNHVDYEEVGALLVSRQIDGLILLATLLPFGATLEQMGEGRRLPVVVGCEPITSELTSLPSVHIDNEEAAFEATKYLIDIGHSDIAFVHGGKASLLTQDREQGFRKAMAASGLSVHEDFIQAGFMTVDGGVTSAKYLLGKARRPTAIFFANDEMALGALHAIARAGFRVPEDISVMGFDDSRYAAVASPPLSTVAQPAREIGERVADRMLAELDGTADHEKVVDLLPHRLVIRQSTGRPPRYGAAL